MVVELALETDDNKTVIRDFFSREPLIELDASSKGYNGIYTDSQYYATQECKYEPLNEYFQDINFMGIDIIFFRFYFVLVGNTEYDDMFRNDIGFGSNNIYYVDSHFYTRREIAEIYVKYLPEKNRINVYDLHPELKEENVKVLN